MFVGVPYQYRTVRFVVAGPKGPCLMLAPHFCGVPPHPTLRTNRPASLAVKVYLLVHAPVTPVPPLRSAQPSRVFVSTHMPTGREYCCNQLTHVTVPEIVWFAAAAGGAQIRLAAATVIQGIVLKRFLAIVFPVPSGSLG